MIAKMGKTNNRKMNSKKERQTKVLKKRKAFKHIKWAKIKEMKGGESSFR